MLGGSWSRGDTWRPRSCPNWDVGTGATGTRGTLGATLRREVGVGAAGPRGTPGAV
jgi:hypothetical protein